jgi:hypothetical protein
MDDITSVAAAAGTYVAGYLAQGAKQLGDKVRDGAVERLWQLIEPRLRGTASGAAALDNLAQQPEDPSRASMVGAVTADLAHADPEFAAQLRHVVGEIHRSESHSQGGSGATAAGAQVNLAQDRGSRFHARDFVVGNMDKSKHTIRIGTGGIIMGVLALTALLVGAGIIGIRIGDGPGAATAEPAQAGSTRHTPAPAPTTISRPAPNLLIQKSPAEAIDSVYSSIVSVPQEKFATPHDLTHSCEFMSRSAAVDFARDLGYTTCATAVGGIKKEIKSEPYYVHPVLAVMYFMCETAYGREQTPAQKRLVSGLHVGDCDTTERYLNGALPGQSTATIDSCLLNVEGGPALGVFIVTKIDQNWIVTGHQAGPKQC